MILMETVKTKEQAWNWYEKSKKLDQTAQSVENLLSDMAKEDELRKKEYQIRKCNRYADKLMVAAQQLLETTTPMKKRKKKNPITTFIIAYVDRVDYESGFILSLDHVMLLCEKNNIVFSEAKCFRAMRAAAAGLGAKLKNCKVSFLQESEASLCICKAA
jgi:hypothetical protein